MTRGLLAMVIAAAAATAAAHPALASRVIEVSGSESNSTTLETVVSIELRGDPGRLDVAIPRAEALTADGEIAFFNQDVSVVHDCSPPASLEDRSGWCTMLTWYPGTLHGRSEVTIRTRTTAHQAESLPGLRDPLSRLPGEFYTAYTPTIEHVPGIEEAIRFLDATQGSVPNLPAGDVGLAERWIAYLHGVLQEGTCTAPGRIDGAAWAWNSGVADCDGFSNVFVSGMRTLSIPSCVMLGYVMPGGPHIDMFSLSHGEGLHAWAGCWSEPLGKFVPLDPLYAEFGFLDAQRLHFFYLEDLDDYQMTLWADNNNAYWRPMTSHGSGTSSSATYPVVRYRNFVDGFDEIVFAHHVTNLNGPGGPSGVPEGGPPDRGTLRVSTPFRHVLSVSLVVPGQDVATVQVFDAAGRRVADLARERPIPEGESFFRWIPGEAPAGVYFVRAVLEGGQVLKVLTEKTVRVR